MRLHPLVILAIAAAAVPACERSTDPTVAALSGTANQSTFSISPPRASVNIGSVIQLSTNVPAAQQTQIQWSSQDPTIASIGPTGVVLGVKVGTTIINARLSSDTTQVASSTIDVVNPTGNRIP